MFRTLALLAGAVALSGATAAPAADDAKAVIEKAIKAHGGGDYLTKHKAAQSRAKGKLDIPGVGEVEFTQDTAYMLPDKFKDAMEFTVAGQKVSVLTLANGDKVSVEVNGKAIDLPDGAKASLKDVPYLLKVGRLVELREKGFDLDLIGEDKVDGKAVVGVRVSSKGQKDVSLYFDKKTHLLAKMEHRGADPTTGIEVQEERIVTEYAKDKNGVPLPKKVVVKRDGKQFVEADVLEIAYLEKLDDAEFKK